DRWRFLPIKNQNADGLGSVTGGLEKAQRHVSHINLITLMHGHERELCVGPRSEIDFRPGTRGKLMMAGYKIGVAVSLDNIFDNQTLRLGLFNIDVDIPLRINDRGFRARPYQLRSVRKAPEVKLAECMRRFYHPTGEGISSIWVKVRALSLRYEPCWRPAHERRTPLQTKDLHDSRSPN